MASVPKTAKHAADKKHGFHQRLLLGFLQCRSLAALKARSGEQRFADIGEQRQTRSFHELIRSLCNPNKLPEASLPTATSVAAASSAPAQNPVPARLPDIRLRPDSHPIPSPQAKALFP